MQDFTLEVLACPTDGCGGRLQLDRELWRRRGRLVEGVIACDKCRALYPVLGGVPIMVPAPGEWLASYREPVLASLAEHGFIGRDTVATVSAFSAPFEGAEPLRFGDDWVKAERTGTVSPPAAAAEGEAGRAFADFLRAAERGPGQAMLEALATEPTIGTLVELGPGAGSLTRELCNRAERLIAADLSLRSVLVTVETAGAGSRDGALQGLVCDAQDLPFRTSRIDAIVGANVIDLLDDPEDLLESAARSLKKGGQLILTTPRPDLGRHESGPGELKSLCEQAGLEVLRVEDGIPWIRPHSERHHEVYFTQLLVARRPKGR